jgi:hypothetical protein
VHLRAWTALQDRGVPVESRTAVTPTLTQAPPAVQRPTAYVMWVTPGLMGVLVSCVQRGRTSPMQGAQAALHARKIVSVPGMGQLPPAMLTRSHPQGAPPRVSVRASTGGMQMPVLAIYARQVASVQVVCRQYVPLTRIRLEEVSTIRTAPALEDTTRRHDTATVMVDSLLETLTCSMSERYERGSHSIWYVRRMRGVGLTEEGYKRIATIG